MKRIIILISFVAQCFSGLSQGIITFDNSTDLFRITIDTTIPGNKWQIGIPQKAFFSSSYSLPKAIVTDTINPYPANNTSVFYLGTGGDFGDNPNSHNVYLDFFYRMNSDSLLDFGKIEISLNTGQTWCNVTRCGGLWVYDSYGNLKQMSFGNGPDTIVFTGWTNGWFHFHHNYWNIPWGRWIDTVIYRFTFHSHNTPSNPDGWMIDNLHFYDTWETIHETSTSDALYPNPASNTIHIDSKYQIKIVEIFNSLGNIVKRIDANSCPSSVDVSFLSPGIYHYRIFFENGGINTGKLIKLP